MLGIAVTSAAGTGCMGYAAVRGGADDVIDGAAVGYEGPVSRLRIGLEAGYERLPTASGEQRGVAGYDATLRLGFISTVLDAAPSAVS